jgi:predicted membrane protein
LLVDKKKDMETITFNNHDKETNCFIKRKLVSTGIVFILLAVAILTGKLGFIPENILSHAGTWQGIITILGLVGFVFKPFRMFPMLLIANGVLFTYVEYYSAEYTFSQVTIPAVLASIGLLMISKIFSKSKHSFSMKTEVYQGNSFERNLVFSGIDTLVQSEEFTGGDIRCTFGGAQVDLRNVKLKENNVNVLNLNCVFGGVKLVAKSDMQINVESSSIFGGFADERSNIEKSDPNKPSITVKGKFIFGGGVIENNKEN